jgi:hypothetical protein
MAEKGSGLVEITVQKRDKKGRTNSVKRMVYPKLYGKERRYERCKEALERAEERDKRSAKQQLEVLDRRLGKGVGAKKERERLAQQVAKAKAKSNKAEKKNKKAKK